MGEFKLNLGARNGKLLQYKDSFPWLEAKEKTSEFDVLLLIP